MVREQKCAKNNTCLSLGASPTALNSDNQTALHVACEAHSGEADATTEPLEMLLTKCDPLMVDAHKRTPLHLVFVNLKKENDTTACDPIALVSTLLNAMRSSKLTASSLLDDRKRTPLHYAAMRGANISIMRMMAQFDKSIVRFIY
jgi:ankyrin repeat protein